MARNGGGDEILFPRDADEAAKIYKAELDAEVRRARDLAAKEGVRLQHWDEAERATADKRALNKAGCQQQPGRIYSFYNKNV